MSANDAAREEERMGRMREEHENEEGMKRAREETSCVASEHLSDERHVVCSEVLVVLHQILQLVLNVDVILRSCGQAP
eukprot:768143-Hanusia_phi.AAC.5